MSSTTRARFSKTTYLRFSLAAILFVTALGLGAFRIAENAGAAGSANAPQQPAKPALPSQAKATARAKAALEKLRPRATTAITSHVAKETGNYDFVRASDRGVLTTDNSSASAEQRAFAFLVVHGGLRERKAGC